jgi:hypothetical protein
MEWKALKKFFPLSYLNPTLPISVAEISLPFLLILVLFFGTFVTLARHN